MSGDLGLFGPSSVAWRIHGDPSSLIGGLRALMIQALDPRAMAVVAASPTFATDPWGRFRRTSEYIMTTTFGDTAAAEAAGARVRALHARIRAVDPATGRAQRADDPELLLWVHNVEVDSFLAGYRRYGGWLSRADGDRYVREMAAAARLVGIAPPHAPRNLGELRDYLGSVTGLEATSAARKGLELLLNPPMPALARPLWAIPAGAAVAILPSWARRLYGIPWLPGADLPLTACTFGLCRAMNLLLPPPQILKDARARAAAA